MKPEFKERSRAEYVQRVVTALRSTRIDLSNEKRTQNDIADALSRYGIVHLREYRLSSADIVDFFIDGVGLEVKLKARKMTIYRQLRCYAMYPKITALILVTNTSMGLPEVIEGKPVYVFKMGEAWL